METLEASSVEKEQLTGRGGREFYKLAENPLVQCLASSLFWLFHRKYFK